MTGAEEIYEAAVEGLVTAESRRAEKRSPALAPDESVQLDRFRKSFPGTKVGAFEPFASEGATSTTEPLADGVRFTALADIKMRRVRFAWEQRIPLGALTLIAGVPGQGKSTLVLELGARLTRGQLKGDLYSESCDIVIASAEDAPSFVVAPRFTAAGGDLTRAHVVSVHRDDADLGITIPDDLEEVGEKMRQTGARLLIVDPLLAHIPASIDGYKDQHVRIALAPLARLAEELDAAVVGVMHLNKRDAADLFSRIGGSGGFLAACRSALLVAPDPGDEAVRVVAHGKANLSPMAGSLKFQLKACTVPGSDSDDAPISVAGIAWCGESELGVHSLLGGMGKTPREKATGWLV